MAGGVTISTANCTDYQPTQGISGDTITFGSSFPQSGLYAAYAQISKGYLAYFKYINAQGGVQGKQINMITKDDQYDSGKTATNVKELTQQDKVFALFNIVGTASNMAVRDDLADACIPNLFLANRLAAVGRCRPLPVADRVDPVLRHRVGDLRRLPQGQQAGRQGGDPRPER